MKTAFITHCSDNWYYPVGCNKLVASWKYHHPDIDCYVINTKTLNELNLEYDNKLNWDNLIPITSLHIHKLGYDKVVHFDADSFVCGQLDELLETTSEVFGVRNNNDKGHASRDCDPPITIFGVDPINYMNAGLVGSSNIEFWKTWIDMNFSMTRFPYAEQDVYNLLLKEKSFTFECLDPIESDVYYGIASLSGIETHWDSLKDVYIENDKFMLNEKQLKVIHQAGGHSLPKLDFDKLFSREVAAVMNERYNK